MRDIVHAAVRRTLELNGRLCAEVEARTDDPNAPELLVYYAMTPAGGLEAVRIARNDASPEIDWYDNPMHQAVKDVSSPEDEDTDALLAGRALAFGNVAEEATRALERGSFERE